MGGVAGDSIFGVVGSAVLGALGWAARRIDRWQKSIEKSVADVREDAATAIVDVGVQIEVLDDKVDHVLERLAHIEGVLGVTPVPPWRGRERRRASPAQRAQGQPERRRRRPR